MITFLFSLYLLQLILAAGIRQSVKKPDLEHPLVLLPFLLTLIPVLDGDDVGNTIEKSLASSP